MRRYPARPILGVGAVVLQRNSVLLVERGREPLKGYWSLPGGVLEVGECLEDAVRREVLEETGLLVKPLGVVEIFQRIMEGVATEQTVRPPEYHYVIVDYLCKLVGGATAPASDAAAVAWVKRGELADYRITEGTLRVIEKAFSLRRQPLFRPGPPLIKPAHSE
jgi:8-oxo-dGTP diphosphatase